MSADPQRHRRIMASLRETANRIRDTADEIAGRREGCDDPMHPFTFPKDANGDQVFENWQDFTRRVCLPLVEAEGDDTEAEVQAAMRLYRQVSPYYVAVSLVMALNNVERLEASRDAP